MIVISRRLVASLSCLLVVAPNWAHAKIESCGRTFGPLHIHVVDESNWAPQITQFRELLRATNCFEASESQTDKAALSITLRCDGEEGSVCKFRKKINNTASEAEPVLDSEQDVVDVASREIMRRGGVLLDALVDSVASVFNKGETKRGQGAAAREARGTLTLIVSGGALSTPMIFEEPAPIWTERDDSVFDKVYDRLLDRALLALHQQLPTLDYPAGHGIIDRPESSGEEPEVASSVEMSETAAVSRTTRRDRRLRD